MTKNLSKLTPYFRVTNFTGSLLVDYFSGTLISTGKSTLVMRIHGYLSRYGFINFGVFQQLNPLLGIILFMCVRVTFPPNRQNAIQGGSGGSWCQWAYGCQTAAIFWTRRHSIGGQSEQTLVIGDDRNFTAFTIGQDWRSCAHLPPGSVFC